MLRFTEFLQESNMSIEVDFPVVALSKKDINDLEKKYKIIITPKGKLTANIKGDKKNLNSYLLGSDMGMDKSEKNKLYPKLK